MREFGGTGAPQVGADTYGSTAPAACFGKGLGDLPIGWLRALGVTGEFIYTVADVALKATPVPGAAGALADNDGTSNSYFGAVSLQYSLPYRKAQVVDLGLPDWINRLVPTVETSWTSPATRPATAAAQWLIAPGVFYVEDTWDLGAELLIPGNRAAGSNVGIIAQFHVFLDDMFPGSIFHPLFE